MSQGHLGSDLAPQDMREPHNYFVRLKINIICKISYIKFFHEDVLMQIKHLISILVTTFDFDFFNF